jgi:hypothetical protein
VTLSCLRRFVAGLSPRRAGVEASPVCVRFVANTAATVQVFLGGLLFYISSIIPSMFHTHLCLETTFSRKTKT